MIGCPDKERRRRRAERVSVIGGASKDLRSFAGPMIDLRWRDELFTYVLAGASGSLSSLQRPGIFEAFEGAWWLRPSDRGQVLDSAVSLLLRSDPLG